MSKYLVIAAALVVLAVACNKKEETAAPAEEGTTIEQTAPATEVPADEVEAMPADEAAPADAQ